MFTSIFLRLWDRDIFFESDGLRGWLFVSWHCVNISSSLTCIPVKFGCLRSEERACYVTRAKQGFGFSALVMLPHGSLWVMGTILMH